VRGHAVKAFVVLADSAAPLSRAEIIDACRRSLAPTSVPKHIEFVSALPRGATGKVDKTALS
jgi:acyl-coenzyme A synthetase/AMP-(fatty) acid ligase